MRRSFKALMLIPALATLMVFGAGEILSRPAVREIGDPPLDLNATVVRIPITSEDYIVGWFSRGKIGAGSVLLFHSVRSDRREMLDRARFLKEAGYSVLLVDLPAHGESSGSRITFGANESRGVEAALEYVSSQAPGEKIGAIGVSLGAASLVFARSKWPFSALVLESMYPTIREAVVDRLAIRLGSVGANLAPLLLWQLSLRTGVSVEQLRPIAALANLNAPVLIASGSEDRHTTLAETERIFSAANEPKALWVVQGAAHVNLHAYNRVAYEARILGHFAKHLANGA